MNGATLLNSKQIQTNTVERPRLGFIGLGWIGTHRLQAIKQADVADIVAIVDPAEEMLATAAVHAPEAIQCRKASDLLALGLDGIVIATPNLHHASLAISAFEAGLSVFCQKPLGRNRVETAVVIEAARSANRLLGVDLSYRFTRAFQYIRHIVREQALGEIFAVDLVFHNSYGPQKPWFYDPEQSGGGCVLDLGIHLIDAALWILEQPVVGVRSRLFHRGERMSSRSGWCEDFASAQLDTASGAVINLNCSWNLNVGRDAVIGATFYGTSGGVRLRNVDGSFYFFAAERFVGPKGQVVIEPSGKWFGLAAVEWARQLAADPSYDPEIERVIEVMAVLDSIYENCNS
jgi:predicted dehydrogenase